MSALGHLRVPLAAFLAAALAGVGLGLVLQGGEEERPAARAGAPAAPAVTTRLATQEIPETPSLRVGTSPASAPVAASPAAPPSSGTQSQPQTQQPQQPQQQSGSPSGGGFQVTDENVASP